MSDVVSEKLEDVIAGYLDDLGSQNLDDKSRKELIAGTCALLDQKNTMDKNQIDLMDKESRAAIEREKMDTSIELENKKNEMSKPRMALEIAKIVIPVVAPILAYGIFQRRVLEFEETGRINSTAGRELHLPKFMK